MKGHSFKTSYWGDDQSTEVVFEAVNELFEFWENRLFHLAFAIIVSNETSCQTSPY